MGANSIGQRRFRDNFQIRTLLFDSIIKSIILYGAEVWGWREFMLIEKCQDTYFKWTMGLDRNTPNYLVREETKRDLLRIAAGKRAVKYEEKIRSLKENAILRECLRKLDNPRKNKSPWETDGAVSK